MSENKKEPLNVTTLFLSIALASLFLFFISLSNFYSRGLLTALDEQTNQFSIALTYPIIVNLSEAISSIFEPINTLIISGIILLFLWYKDKKEDSIFFIITLALTALFTLAIKILTLEQRPLNALIYESSFSFPSGHSAAAITFFGFLIYLFWKYGKSANLKITFYSIFSIICLAVILSRLYLRVHWLSDVLGGVFLGLFILFSSLLLKIHFDNEHPQSKSIKD